MFIKTRSSVMSEYDNSYPNISVAYNNKSIKVKVLLLAENIYDSVVTPSIGRHHLKDEELLLFSNYLTSALTSILDTYVNPYTFKNKTTQLHCIAFTDKRIGLVGVTDSRINACEPIVQIKCKHVFDFAGMTHTSVITPQSIAHDILTYADKFVAWVLANNYGSKNVIYNGDIKKYVELSLDKSFTHESSEVNKALEFINKCLKDNNVLIRDMIPRLVRVSEVIKV